MAIVQQLRERDTQLAQLQDEYARLISYMQWQRDQQQAQHAPQLALMATDHVRRLDVHEEEISSCGSRRLPCRWSWLG